VRSADLSENFKSVEHSFSGTAEQKANATAVYFLSPPQIEFLPKSMLNDFPRLNGIIIGYCKTLTIIRENLFTQDFEAIQYLSFNSNKIATIEENAFQHLPNLKWINLGVNQLRSLPHQLFRNNPEMILIWLYGNQINSITPDFFKNLNKLQRVDFNPNECTNKELGCISGSCLVSQSELDTALSACYNNFLQDGKRA
jgi:Leucine-rich repeat (LRR) protein